MRKKEIEKRSEKLKGDFSVAQKVLSVFLFGNNSNEDMKFFGDNG